MAQYDKDMRVGAREGFPYHSVRLVNENRYEVDYNNFTSVLKPFVDLQYRPIPILTFFTPHLYLYSLRWNWDAKPSCAFRMWLQWSFESEVDFICVNTKEEKIKIYPSIWRSFNNSLQLISSSTLWYEAIYFSQLGNVFYSFCFSLFFSDY
jgi:hypothetical protein